MMAWFPRNRRPLFILLLRLLPASLSKELACLFRDSPVERSFEELFGLSDTLGSDAREPLGSIRPFMLEVFVPDLLLFTRVNVEPMLEVAYVELEFSMLPDLVV
jgi:hypothetical protein